MRHPAVVSRERLGGFDDLVEVVAVNGLLEEQDNSSPELDTLGVDGFEHLVDDEVRGVPGGVGLAFGEETPGLSHIEAGSVPEFAPVRMRPGGIARLRWTSRQCRPSARLAMSEPLAVLPSGTEHDTIEFWCPTPHP